jgi:hypothetical protein
MFCADEPFREANSRNRRWTVFDPSDSEVFWLNATNLALGLATLAFVIAVTTVVVQTVWKRLRKRAELREEAGHTLYVDDLGITMADGGKRRKDSEEIDEGE